jgi:dTDP-4-amino-4,6-dideoxygalactose transaminase
MSNTAMVPLAVPAIGPREIELVTEAVTSGYVSSVGPFVTEFENKFAQTVGSQYAVACATGTAALHVALRVLGVGAGDEVAVSDFTFVGSVNPIAYQGASPLFVDSEPATWNMDSSLLIEHLTDRLSRGKTLPKAVEVVHVLGQPAQMDDLLPFCQEHGIAVLEDAAESLGARWSQGALAGTHTGTAGAIGAFSFNGNKIVTTGGGGMIVTDDAALAAHARHLTTQAKVPAVGYLHDEVGYNYRLTNVSAALGVAQLERLGEFVDRKRAIATRYDAALSALGITTPPRVPGLDATYWLYSALVPVSMGADGRDLLLKHLQSHNIGARALWRPLHQQPPFQGAQRLGGSVAIDLFERGISLPCSFELTDEQQDRAIDAVKSFFGPQG